MRSVEKYEFTPIIFITSLEDYQLHAYSELHAYSYIEKPFNMGYVKEIVQKALRFPIKVNEDKTLYLMRDKILFALKSSEIIYVESVRHKLHFYKDDGTTLEVPYKTLKGIFKELKGHKFKQCSRNVIFNEDYLEYIDKVNRYIKLKGTNIVIEIGKKYIDEL